MVQLQNCTKYHEKSKCENRSDFGHFWLQFSSDKVDQPKFPELVFVSIGQNVWENDTTSINHITICIDC